MHSLYLKLPERLLLLLKHVGGDIGWHVCVYCAHSHLDLKSYTH